MKPIVFLCLFILRASMGCDLVPEKYALERSFSIDTINSDNDPCLQAEDCLSGPGMRTILRFDSYLANEGRTDCTIGWTPTCPNPNNDGNVPDQFPFHYDQCHKHWHFTGFSEYHLYDMAGNRVAAGQKNGLCLMDVVCQGRKKFTCQNQGISPGCKDIYNKALNCQWIDITDIPDKTAKYKFEWLTNTARLVPESNYNNNVVSTIVDLSKVPKVAVRAGPAPNQCPRYTSTGTLSFQNQGQTYNQQNNYGQTYSSGNTYTGNTYTGNTYTGGYTTTGGNNYYGNSYNGYGNGYSGYNYNYYDNDNSYTSRRQCRRNGYC